VLSFLTETKVLGTDADGDIAEVDAPGLSLDEPTLFCANVAGSYILQVILTRITVIPASLTAHEGYRNLNSLTG
jgi:hypothetical protein